MSVRARCLLIAALLAPAGNAQELPDDWRLPVAADYFNPELAASATPLRADLNGDQQADDIYLLIRRNSQEGAVFVQLAGSPHLRRVSRANQGIADYQLHTLPPGRYASLQGELHLPHNAILVREVEYGTGYVLWLEDGQWQEAPITAGELEPVDPA